MCLGTGQSLQPNPPNGVRKSFYLTHLSYGESILGEPYQIQKPVGVPPAPLIKLKFRCVQYTALDGSALPFNIIRLMASIVGTRTAPNLVPSQQVTLRFVCLFPPQRVPILIKKWGDVFFESVHIFFPLCSFLWISEILLLNTNNENYIVIFLILAFFETN